MVTKEELPGRIGCSPEERYEVQARGEQREHEAQADPTARQEPGAAPERRLFLALVHPETRGGKFTLTRLPSPPRQSLETLEGKEGSPL